MLDIDPRTLRTPVISDLPRPLRVASAAIAAAAFGALIACSPAGRDEARDTVSSAANTVRNEASNAATDVREATNDAALTAKVKSVLLADAQVKGTAINVDSSGGTVTLSGNVETAGQKMRAEELAQGVEGVATVRNNLTAPAS